MARYLIEVSQPDSIAAKRVVRSVHTFGSHFATHADWRHKDGMSTATLVVEADDRRWALGIVPPSMRSGARVFDLGPAVAA
jgi:hypothetical protein